MASIPLSKDRGIDPHLCTCIRCGNVNDQALTMGVIMKAEDNHGASHFANRGGTRKHEQELAKHNIEIVTNWTEIKDSSEKIPMGLCKACEDEIALFEEELAKGGIFFKCKACDQAGMITGNTDLAKAVREQMDIPAPDECGIEFDSCDQHGVNSDG